MSCSFLLQAVGLALTLILMFAFASVAINVLTVVGLVHSVIAWPNLSQCFVYAPPENIRNPLVFRFFLGYTNASLAYSRGKQMDHWPKIS